MPAKNGDRIGITFADVLAHTAQLEDEYAVRIRLSVVPLSRKSGKSTHALEARAYTLQGKPVTAVDRTQCLWPGGTAKTHEGAFMYILTQLGSALDEWFVRRRREEEQWQPGELTPLEEYIAGSYSS